jgi:hypothetical protein
MSHILILKVVGQPALVMKKKMVRNSGLLADLEKPWRKPEGNE